MVARGKGKKASASEAVATISNGDVISQENVSDAVAAPTKKGRARATKKETKVEVDETPPVSAVEISEKPAKPAKVSKSSKKVSKGKGAAKNEEEQEATVEEIKEQNDAPLAEVKPAAAEKKTQGRKRKADGIEKIEEPAPVSKKLPKTKTKAAKKETVDGAGIPEDPRVVAAAEVAAEPKATQTNGAKKSTVSRKRSTTKAEEPVVKLTAIPTDDLSQVPVKKPSKSKESKKETKKSAKKSKPAKKSANDEDATEDDILPEDEFMPEEEDEEPKVEKAVRSKGSRKQLKEDIPLPEEVAKKIESIPEKAIEKEKKTTKSKKPAEKKQTEKKVTTKRGSKKEKDETNEVSNDEQSTAEVDPPEGKTNGTVKPKAAPAEKKTTARGKKRAAATPIEEADEADGSKNAKPEDLLNPTVTEYSASDFTLNKNYKLKISSWNIAGLRSWLKKDGLRYMEYEQPDILCLQEIKCTTDQLPEEARIPGYHPYWLCMPGGHAGVAVYSKIMPIHVEYGIGNAEHDDAGRMITAEYEKFYLICVYVPNSGRKLVNLEKRLQWEALFREYVQRLDKIKPVIIAGDMNVSHKEIDLANPKTNTKNAGFTPQERDAMTKLFELGYVDTFRHFYPKQTGAYSFWSYMGKARSKNVGWRLDYFIVSERVKSKVVESTIRAQVLGSDHCPITLFLNI